ncbi:hypothetical protein E2C01_041814 [Portunus trituberculatus]|uniref:Uncharacterized protein n=1 Tax=Portunus trituberculatus TaxID=210409 RepID=A0A5B7FS02_PORTR|nr:hypothetical protein [Portunus trituberculatus]
MKAPRNVREGKQVKGELRVRNSGRGKDVRRLNKKGKRPLTPSTSIHIFYLPLHDILGITVSRIMKSFRSTESPESSPWSRVSGGDELIASPVNLAAAGSVFSLHYHLTCAPPTQPSYPAPLTSKIPGYTSFFSSLQQNILVLNIVVGFNSRAVPRNLKGKIGSLTNYKSN